MTLVARRTRSNHPVVTLFTLGGMLLFAASMTAVITAIAIWPGEVKLFASFFCSDARPDAYVVSDVYRVQPGETSTSYTMYCMGPRGDVTDVGFLWPFVAVVVLHAVLIVAFGMALAALKRLRGRPSDSVEFPPTTSGPFVSS